MSESPSPVEPAIGLQTLLGYRVVHWAPNEARVALTVDRRHLNRGQLLHGGVLTTLIDTAGGYAGCFCPEPGRVRRAATISLATQFLASVGAGTVTASARVRGGGQRIFAVSVEVHDDRGTLLAIGEGSFRYRTGSEDPRGVPIAEEK